MKLHKDIELATGRYKMHKGVLEVCFVDRWNREFGIADAKEHISTYSYMRRQHGRPPEFLDFREFGTLIDMSILNFIAKQAQRQRVFPGPRAYIVNSVSALVQIDCFLKLSPNSYYTEIFEDKESAMTWLSQFTEKDVLMN